MMIESRKLLQLLLLWLIFNHCIYRNHREMGSWIQENNFFINYYYYYYFTITWETGLPCLTPPEIQILSVVPECLSVTTLHAQFNITSLIFALTCYSWVHWEINFLGFFLPYSRNIASEMSIFSLFCGYRWLLGSETVDKFIIARLMQPKIFPLWLLVGKRVENSLIALFTNNESFKGN